MLKCTIIHNFIWFPSNRGLRVVSSFRRFDSACLGIFKSFDLPALCMSTLNSSTHSGLRPFRQPEINAQRTALVIQETRKEAPSELRFRTDGAGTQAGGEEEEKEGKW